MKINISKVRSFLATILLILMVVTTTACSSSSSTATLPNPMLDRTEAYTQLERGNSLAGQKFGDWVVSTSQGLVSDAYVRDNNKLGIVISSQVKPTEVKTLAKSLTMGFQSVFVNNYEVSSQKARGWSPRKVRFFDREIISATTPWL